MDKNLKRSLNKRFTFETFVVGKENEAAFKLAKRIASCRCKEKAIYICNKEPGLGVTHLLQAIEWKIGKKHPRKKIIYMNADEFLEQYVRNLKNATTDALKNYYEKNVFCFILDSFSFVKEKSSLQNYLRDIIINRIQRGKLTIFGGDIPKNIKSLDKNLKSAIDGFLVAEIHRPAFDLRLAILRKIQKREGTNFDNETLKLFARHIKKSVRLLEGAMYMLMVSSKVTPDIPYDKIARDILTKMGIE